MNEEQSIIETEKILKSLGIKKTFEECHDDYFNDRKRMKSYKIIEKFNIDNGIVFCTGNPYHIFNQFYYFNGIKESNLPDQNP